MKNEKTAMLSAAEVSGQQKLPLSRKIVEFFRKKRKKKETEESHVSREN